MTEKLPRRWSKRVVVSGGSLPAGVTRVVSSSAISSPASSSPAVAVDGAADAEQAARLEPVHLEPVHLEPVHLEPVSEPASRELPRGKPSRREPPSSEVVSTERVRVDAAREQPLVPEPLVPEPSRGPRALVVDDDPEIRRALARLLRPELDVFLVGSVAQAKAALSHLDRVDVAFVDWELPDGTGEEILEQLVHWPDAIRVLISARVVSSENPLKNRALANLVLGKPLALSVVEALKRAALALPQD